MFWWFLFSFGKRVLKMDITRRRGSSWKFHYSPSAITSTNSCISLRPVLLHKINELNSQPNKKTEKQISIRHD
jgi:hypothetical protein